MLSELHSLNLKLCIKQYNKKFDLHLIVAPQLGGGRRHNYSTKTRQAGHANEQSMYSLTSMGAIETKFVFSRPRGVGEEMKLVSLGFKNKWSVTGWRG